MNPLDFNGPTFLAFYFVLLLPAVALAFGVRWLLRMPGGYPMGAALELNPYETAYLAGGEQTVFNSVVARLVRSEALTTGVNNNLMVGLQELREGATDIDSVVYKAVLRNPGPGLRDAREAASPIFEQLKERLLQLELLVEGSTEVFVRFVPFIMVAIVPLFGILKITVGMSRNRPVLFLAIMCLVSAVISRVFLIAPVRRSRRGDWALSLLKQRNAAIEQHARHRSASLSGDDLLLAVGLFGLGVVAGSTMRYLQSTLDFHRKSNGWTSYGGCGTGCGGGGGGCGGGGCGGGGCGGCGG